MSELLLMRHAKSDWHVNARDIDRPLNKRGQRDARLIGNTLSKLGCVPDRIIVSPARRTLETVEKMTAAWSIPAEYITTDNELYLASSEVIVELSAAYLSGCERLMVVAHNPGMDDAVDFLADVPPRLSVSGKLMVTAAVARFAVDELSQLEHSGRCHLINLLRPREIQI